MSADKPMSPAEKEARQMIADKKADEANERAYNAASSLPMSPKSPASAPKKLAKGGTASARADGIAQRGKTKGRMC